MSNNITVQATLSADMDKVWSCWTKPEHIVNWNFATDEWMCPEAVNNLVLNGTFSWRMEARDGNMGFDYRGTYTTVRAKELIELLLDDGRKVTISFKEEEGLVRVTETFEADENDPELQRQGWQAILNNFKKYVESNQE